MSENQKLQVLTQEVIRRLGNTYEGLVYEDYTKIIDDFSQKLFNSGYKMDQIRRIIIAGIKGWGGKVRRCQEEGRRLRRTARDSQEQRMRTKLIGKSSWFKRKGGQKIDWYKMGEGQQKKRKNEKVRKVTTTTTPKSVLFVDQTPGGELAIRMRELFSRIEPTVGFHLKVVERTGLSLQSQFPLTTLWDGAPCGRVGECITCYQGAEMVPNCTKQSVVYENVCSKCVPSAVGDKELKLEELQGDLPVLYVGETSRSIAERSREHWALYRRRGEDNHMVRHQDIAHGGEEAKFTMRVIGSYRSALGRQVSEAIRIRRRGGLGSILNSKSEYNRCHISRLRVEDEKEEEEREQETRREQEQIDTDLVREQEEWERSKTKSRDAERRRTVERIKDKGAGWKGAKKQKRTQLGSKEAPSKRRKYALLWENWGNLPITEAREPLEPLREQSVLHPGSNTTMEQDKRELVYPNTPASHNPEVELGPDTTAITLLRDKTLTQQDITGFLLPSREEGRADSQAGLGSSDGVARGDYLGGDRYDTDEGYECVVNVEEDSDNYSDQINTVSGTGGYQHVRNTVCEAAPSVGNTDTLLEQTMMEDDILNEEDGETLRDEDEACHGHSVVAEDVGVVTKQNNMNDKDVSECVSMSKEPSVCSFTKKGVCVTHNIKGDVLKTKTKVWRKKKYGYGWVTTTTVTYKCSMAGVGLIMSTGSTSELLSPAPSLANNKGDYIVGSAIGGMVGQE